MAVSIDGIDCASTITNPAAIKAAGKHFVCRYLSTPGNPKNLGAAEARGMHAAGLGVVTVFETTANRAMAGEAAGADDATSAHRALQALSAPANAPVYFAVDFDAQPADMAAIRQYFAGCASVLGKGRTGIYGGLHPVKAMFDAGAVHYGWQTYAWSGTPTVWDPRAHLHQYKNGVTVAGISVDLDRAHAADYGQWGGATVPVKHFKRPKGVNTTWSRRDGSRVTKRFRGDGWFKLRHPRAIWRGPVDHKPIH
jgi:hypothetical protein